MPQNRNLREQLFSIPINTSKSAVHQSGTKIDIQPKSLEERAAIEILNNLKEGQSKSLVNGKLIISSVESSSIIAKESTLSEYEAIPISSFGMAMLRGMGLKDDNLNKQPEEPIKQHSFRPSGMGLGADSDIQPKVLKVPLRAGETLVMKKGAFVIILAGKYKDFYGTVSLIIF